MKHTQLLMSLIAALSITFTSQAQAQVPSGYPNKPIRMILPLAVGSAVDVAARLLAQKMSTNMGQSIVIENITGAAGIIGADKLAKAAPDGYTIGGFNDSVVTMVPNLNPNTPYNPLKDFTYVSLVATVEFCLAVPPDSPYKTTADLIAAAKKAMTKMFWVVDGDAQILDTFNFDHEVDEYNLETVHVWRSQNPVNGLTYGYGGVKLLPRKLTMNMDINTLDMTLAISDKFKAIDVISNTTAFNTDPFNTWKSAFRECVKLKHYGDEESLNRLIYQRSCVAFLAEARFFSHLMPY